VLFPEQGNGLGQENDSLARVYSTKDFLAVINVCFFPQIMDVVNTIYDSYVTVDKNR
jgi:hypothetical protein